MPALVLRACGGSGKLVQALALPPVGTEDCAPFATVNQRLPIAEAILAPSGLRLPADVNKRSAPELRGLTLRLPIALPNLHVP